jgi:hypothetical protein
MSPGTGKISLSEAVVLRDSLCFHFERYALRHVSSFVTHYKATATAKFMDENLCFICCLTGIQPLLYNVKETVTCLLACDKYSYLTLSVCHIIKHVVFRGCRKGKKLVQCYVCTRMRRYLHYEQHGRSVEKACQLSVTIQ